jgi:uncharacterized BrkB/YihY/UPF0761 family membrane protein
MFRLADEWLDGWAVYLAAVSPLLFLAVLGVVGELVQTWILASAGCR